MPMRKTSMTKAKASQFDIDSSHRPYKPSPNDRFHRMQLAVTTRGLWATDHVILNHGQVAWTTPEVAPPSPNYHTTPTGGRFSSRQI
ncbi:hypothetical protein TNCV_889881 [Trichonephila clavipes]|nr:hypothetical protein TNCV_889881 [Trichonephila clavipes]